MHHKSHTSRRKDCLRSVAQSANTIASQIVDKFPDRIEAVFREDYDIISVDKMVSLKIINDINSSFKFDTDIARLEKEVACGTNLVKIKTASEIRDRLIVEKLNLCNPQRIVEYRKRAEVYLKRYREIKSTPRKFDLYNPDIDEFGRKIYIPTEEDYQRIDVIVKYLNLVNEYIPVIIRCTGYKPSNISTLCHDCGCNLSDYVTVKSGSIECPFCGKVCYLGSRIITNKMNKCTQKHHNSEYEDLSTFVKTIEHFQGKIIPKISFETLEADLDEHFSKIGIDCGAKIRAQPNTPDGKKVGTNLELMVTALKERNYDCYDEIYFICNIYWGWIPHNISHLIDKLTDAFIKVQYVWQTLTIEERGRKSNIPARLILCELLRIFDYPCFRSDFKLPKNVDKYKPIWKIMCEKCGDPRIYFIND